MPRGSNCRWNETRMSDRQDLSPPSAADHPAAEPGELFPPPEHRASAVRRTLTGTLGIVCIVLGIILGILPIVPGFPLIAVGVLLLVASSEPSRRALNRVERRLPAKARKLLRKLARRSATPY